LIEGSGGLMVPLGEGYFVVDLIAELDCETIVVARNRLGTLNHTILTVNALQRRTKRSVKVALMDGPQPDFSTSTNRKILLQTLAPVEVFGLPFLGAKACRPEGVKKSAKKVKKTLASILG
jgi:dethiobiotin synthetase